MPRSPAQSQNDVLMKMSVSVNGFACNAQALSKTDLSMARVDLCEVSRMKVSLL